MYFRSHKNHLRSIVSSRIQGLTGQRATGERESQLSSKYQASRQHSSAKSATLSRNWVPYSVSPQNHLPWWKVGSTGSSERRFCMEFSSKNLTLLKILGSLPVSFTNDTLADFWGIRCPKDPIMMMTNLFEDHQLFVLLPTQHFFLTQWIRKAL